MSKVIVIGGGPAGLMAAGQAALRGATVTLLEKMDRPARKLRLTGNGRCNLTNLAPVDEFIRHFGPNGKFLRPAFSQFFAPELMDFFERLKVKLVRNDKGRVYPGSDSADDVADALIKWVMNSGVKINNRTTITKILRDDNRIKGVHLVAEATVVPADAVILATGGASYPATGSTGDGYLLAKSLGHNVTAIRPASVALISPAEIARALHGISLNSVAVTVTIEGKSLAKDNGDLLFTHFGVSGPLALSLSRNCVDQLRAGKQPILLIDLIPEYDEKQLDEILQKKFETHGKGQVGNILGEWLPRRMGTWLLSRIKIEPSKRCSHITASERRDIRQRLKGLELKIIGHRPHAEAMVTAGGINLKEINSRTMKSRLIGGLYFAGEALDLDADTGGFNLQAAFSTGWLAGRNCPA